MLPPRRPCGPELTQWPAVSTSRLLGVSIAVAEQKPRWFPWRTKRRPLTAKGGTAGSAIGAKLESAVRRLPRGASSGGVERIRAGVQ